MHMRTSIIIPTLIVFAAQFPMLGSAAAGAIETENLGMSVVPAPGKVTVDGKIDDWDLSGGIFACGDVEARREQLACWFHIMYDAENLYVLARWIDSTPMNNTGNAYGYEGDCLQVRFITGSETPQKHVTHFTAWYSNRTKRDRMYVAYGRMFRNLGFVKGRDAQQAFLKNADGKGYHQELSISWKLLAKDGKPLKAGDKLVMTLEPNFSIGPEGKGRLSVKDVFKPGVHPERIQTYWAYDCWGTAVLEPEGNLKPRPVRLSDGQEFAVKMEGKVPVVDWGGVVEKKHVPVAVFMNVEMVDAEPFVVRKPRLHVVRKSTRRLSVNSTPITGVKITGDKTGATNYTAACPLNIEMVLFARPQAVALGKRYNFVRWKVDADERPQGLLKVQMTMDADHVATAVYEIQHHRLSIQSTPISSIPISGDNQGVTNYMTLCSNRQQVRLAAPKSRTASGKRYNFIRWIVDGTSKPKGVVDLQITMNADHTAIAAYEADHTANKGDTADLSQAAPSTPVRGSTSLGWPIAMVGLGMLSLLGAVTVYSLWGRKRNA